MLLKSFHRFHERRRKRSDSVEFHGPPRVRGRTGSHKSANPSPENRDGVPARDRFRFVSVNRSVQAVQKRSFGSHRWSRQCSRCSVRQSCGAALRGIVKVPGTTDTRSSQANRGRAAPPSTSYRPDRRIPSCSRKGKPRRLSHFWRTQGGLGHGPKHPSERWDWLKELIYGCNILEAYTPRNWRLAPVGGKCRNC